MAPGSISYLVTPALLKKDTRRLERRKLKFSPWEAWLQTALRKRRRYAPWRGRIIKYSRSTTPLTNPVNFNWNHADDALSLTRKDGCLSPSEKQCVLPLSFSLAFPPSTLHQLSGLPSKLLISLKILHEQVSDIRKTSQKLCTFCTENLYSLP